MALTKLDQLYRTVILDHSRTPRNKGTLNEADAIMELKNPTCGDLIQIQAKVEDGRITEVKFDGSGCTISMSSASMMTEVIKGKTLDEVKDLYFKFSDLVQGKKPENVKDLGDAEMLEGVSKFPTRVRCATLSWKALNKALDNEGTGLDGRMKHEEIYD